MAKKIVKNSTKSSAKKSLLQNSATAVNKSVFVSVIDKNSVSQKHLIKTPVSRQAIFKSSFTNSSGKNGIQ
ncbi:MAG TPA: hypothetical protein VL651_02610 [Bacteroidia bacterium]|jgi:hypothetical protein|nr:hypothetical protein [Bacteroidia bacterium]